MSMRWEFKSFVLYRYPDKEEAAAPAFTHADDEMVTTYLNVGKPDVVKAVIASDEHHDNVMIIKGWRG